MVLRQLEIDLTQHCTFTKGSGHEFCLWSELIGGIMSSPNLQKRTALFKDLCSKLLASCIQPPKTPLANPKKVEKGSLFQLVSI